MAKDLELTPDKASDELVRHVLEKKIPHQDNMSVIVVERISS
jgi:serine/threonine protein phosphatase PrpC